ncbi:hypothetical protein [Chitinilyticum litopenaei]|uniref:hypothetical protein n=1 Tax=Chitinilyticum litopenaei TaxID=1121276 RepID=UPI00040E9F69|nr:hypothetical protein [Chitinilyticum litopenaei]
MDLLLLFLEIAGTTLLFCSASYLASKHAEDADKESGLPGAPHDTPCFLHPLE